MKTDIFPTLSMTGLVLLTMATATARPAASSPAELALGERGPDFELAGTDGKRHRLADLAGDGGTVLVFTSNRCPYSLLYEGRLIDLARKWQPRGFAFIAINPNDAGVQAGESLADMTEHAESRRFPFPYLRDGDQVVADAYGARVTPHVFVLDGDGLLAYRGRIDDAAQPDEAGQHDLDDALVALSRGEAVPRPSTRAFGCAIKRADAPRR